MRATRDRRLEHATVKMGDKYTHINFRMSPATPPSLSAMAVLVLGVVWLATLAIDAGTWRTYTAWHHEQSTGSSKSTLRMYFTIESTGAQNTHESTNANALAERRK